MLSPLQTCPASLAALTCLLLGLFIHFELPMLSRTWLFQDFGRGASSEQVIQPGARWPELLSVGTRWQMVSPRGRAVPPHTAWPGCSGSSLPNQLLLPLAGTHGQKLQHPPPARWHQLNAQPTPCVTATASSLPLLFFWAFATSQHIQQVVASSNIDVFLLWTGATVPGASGVGAALGMGWHMGGGLSRLGFGF